MSQTVTNENVISILYVNCVARQSVLSQALLAKRVEGQLRAKLKHVAIGENYHDLDFFRKNAIESIEIADHDGSYSADNFVLDDCVKVHANVFEFHTEDSSLSDHVQPPLRPNARPNGEIQGTGAEDEGVCLQNAKVLILPHRTLEHQWRTLIFEERLQFKILKYLLRRISFAARRGSSGVWSHIILFHGPPGSGKTSLCLALAQQLSIRLMDKYPLFKLVKIDAQSIFSRWFSESGKAVSRLFSAIEDMLDQDGHTFVCVLVDEVESLASTRHEQSGSGEPKDVMRAVNALLVAVDRLRQRPNVIIMCTSNLVGAIDEAFLDRVDDKYHIGNPCLAARYEMFRQEYTELLSCGIVIHPEEVLGAYREKDRDLMDVPFDQADAWFKALGGSGLKPNDLPYCAYLGITLHRFAQASLGLSGRVLRNIPERSLSQLTTSDPCPMRAALKAAGNHIKALKAMESRVTNGSVG